MHDAGGAAAPATLPAPGPASAASAADATTADAHERRRMQTQDLMESLRLEVGRCLFDPSRGAAVRSHRVLCGCLSVV